MNWKILVLTLVVVLIAATAVSCGSDGNNSNGNGSDEPDATKVIDDGGETNAGKRPDDGNQPGSATMTIGNETWTFKDIFCGFSPEEIGNDDVSFTLDGFGESADGVRIQLAVLILDPDKQGRYQGQGVIHTVSLTDRDDFDNPSVAWGIQLGFINPQVEDVIRVDGKNVTVVGEFDDGRTVDEFEAVPGTITATCP